jgi:hypothetical protein
MLTEDDILTLQIQYYSLSPCYPFSIAGNTVGRIDTRVDQPETNKKGKLSPMV